MLIPSAEWLACGLIIGCLYVLVVVTIVLALRYGAGDDDAGED